MTEHPKLGPAFKQKLAAGETIMLVNPDHPSPSLVEALGRIGADAVFIDTEQGSPDIETVENMARAARLAGLTSLVRIFDRQDWVIERLMFRGVDGIVAPRVDTVAQAQGVVDAMRYCYPKAHGEKVVVIQIESTEAVGNLDAFLEIDGIDVFFIGPVDLAKSMGFEGDFKVPDVQTEMDRVIARIHAAGGHSGILVDYDNAGRYAAAGVQMLYVHANLFMGAGAATFSEIVEKAR